MPTAVARRISPYMLFVQENHTRFPVEVHPETGKKDIIARARKMGDAYRALSDDAKAALKARAAAAPTPTKDVGGDVAAPSSGRRTAARRRLPKSSTAGDAVKKQGIRTSTYFQFMLENKERFPVTVNPATGKKDIIARARALGDAYRALSGAEKEALAERAKANAARVRAHNEA